MDNTTLLNRKAELLTALAGLEQAYFKAVSLKNYRCNRSEEARKNADSFNPYKAVGNFKAYKEFNDAHTAEIMELEEIASKRQTSYECAVLRVKIIAEYIGKTAEHIIYINALLNSEKYNGVNINGKRIKSALMDGLGIKGSTDGNIMLYGFGVGQYDCSVYVYAKFESKEYQTNVTTRPIYDLTPAFYETVFNPEKNRARLERWINEFYPLSDGEIARDARKAQHVKQELEKISRDFEKKYRDTLNALDSYTAREHAKQAHKPII